MFYLLYFHLQLFPIENLSYFAFSVTYNFAAVERHLVVKISKPYISESTISKMKAIEKN